MREEMEQIPEQELLHIGHYEYGEAFFGSCAGMRYRVAREPLINVRYTPPDKRGEASLRASVWPEPLSYGAADGESIRSRDFPFTAEGLHEAWQWLNEEVPAFPERAPR